MFSFWNLNAFTSLQSNFQIRYYMAVNSVQQSVRDSDYDWSSSVVIREVLSINKQSSAAFVFPGPCSDKELYFCTMKQDNYYLRDDRLNSEVIFYFSE